jgi:hypothetical protein
MQIQKIQNNYNQNYSNLKQKISNSPYINFQGGKQQLIAISKDSFKSESTKKIYSKIQRYFQLIGQEGSLKDTKLLHEKTHYFSSKAPYIIDAEADIYLTIKKGHKNSNIKLYHKYTDIKKNDALIFEATLDKNGQMTNGHFLPGESLTFERGKNNLRRMYSVEKTYMPVGGNDREWSYMGDKISPSNRRQFVDEDSIQGAFEIFLELARLKTSIR